MSASEFFNLAEQKLNPPGSYWGNLGLWPLDAQPLVGTTQEYASACQQLADLLAQQAELNKSSVVLDIGFGCGDQLLLWLQQYQVDRIFGFNYSLSQTLLAQHRLRQHGFEQPAQGCVYGDISQISDNEWQKLQQQKITRVLALDCIYHFPQRQQFLQQVHNTVTDSGHFAFTDIYLKRPLNQLPMFQRWLLKLMFYGSRIPESNVQTLEQQQQFLLKAGFSEVKYQDLSEAVMVGFAGWFIRYKAQQPDKHKPKFWLKYNITARFLRWSYHSGILGYGIFSAKK